MGLIIDRRAMALLAQIRKRLFAIRQEEATVARRGFRCDDPDTRWHLEQVGQTFIRGYNISLEQPDVETLGTRLNEMEPRIRGFAFEGAAMGLAMLDHFSPWTGSRWRRFLFGSGSCHAYMLHVGAGWAAARLPWVRRRLVRHLGAFDPVLRWLVVDGYGFHQGYFYWPRYVEQHTRPTHLSGYAVRAFDQGLGRSLWFVFGASVSRLQASIQSFPLSRRSDLWSGIGLACAYAGGMEADDIRALCGAASEHHSALAQGAAFAAKARLRARNMAEHTLVACEIICEQSVDSLGAITDRCLKQLPRNGDQPAFERWRRSVQDCFSVQNVEEVDAG